MSSKKSNPAGVPARGIVDCTYRNGLNGQTLKFSVTMRKQCRLLVGKPFACVQYHTGRWRVLRAGGSYCWACIDL